MPLAPAPATPLTVAALYKFVRFAAPADLRAPLLAACAAGGLKGTLLLAGEGINGTIAGPAQGIAAVLDHIRAIPGCADLDVKFAQAETMPFHRLKVRIKREIVTMGVDGIDPAASVGTYVDPHDWNALIADPDTVVIDTRNDYEVVAGTFAGAVDPGTTTFRDFPDWFRREGRALVARGKRVAMFCTGGIRCEKSTAYLKQEGVDSVFHLKGGILRYLEDVPAADSLWQGECFVFDERVTVGHALSPGTHALCRACRRPVDAAAQASALYEEAVSCPTCHAERTDDQRAGYRERHRQEQLAAEQGRSHIGVRLNDL